MTQIAVLVGSLRKESINHKVVAQLEKLLPDGVTFVYSDLNLPLYDHDLEAEYPVAAQNLKDIIEQSDGILFFSPEYNRGISGVLKNAIDWASRPHGKNSFDGKPVATAGVSIGPLGTTQAQQQLRNTLVYLNTHIMGQPEVYLFDQKTLTESGELTDEARPFLQEFINAFIAHINRSLLQ